MSKHNPDLVMCRRQTGISIGRLCERDDGRCPICDSYVRPTTLVHICDECAFGNSAGTNYMTSNLIMCSGKCIICEGCICITTIYFRHSPSLSFRPLSQVRHPVRLLQESVLQPVPHQKLTSILLVPHFLSVELPRQHLYQNYS